MLLTPDWAPSLHPLVVHFPIALLTAAGVVDFVGLLWRQSRSVRDAATWLYLAGTAFALIAYFTGRSGVETMVLSAQAEAAVNLHENWAFRTAWFFAFFVSLRLAVSFILPPRSIILIGAFLAGLAGLVMLFETAEHGALLVYHYGLI